jgi:hypothetical protein
MQSDWKTFFFFEKTDKKPVTEILKFVIYNKNYTIIEYVGVDAHLHQPLANLDCSPCSVENVHYYDVYI